MHGLLHIVSECIYMNLHEIIEIMFILLDP